MVNILISFLWTLKKLSRGYPLEEGDLVIIKAYLAYEFNYRIAIPLAVNTILLLLGIVFLLINSYLIGLAFIIIALIDMLYFTPITYVWNRKAYQKALLKFLEHKLEKYIHMNLLYTYYLIHSSYDINKNSVYFFYDDYYFIIIEDLLKAEWFGKKLFKYPDWSSLNKEPITIKLNDIVSFIAKTQKEVTNNTLLDLVLLEIKPSITTQIKLKDFKSITLGNDVGQVLNKIVPYLNEIN